MGELKLVRAVKQIAGPLIAKALTPEGPPAEFWGALTVNESGIYVARGMAPRDITHTEKHVFVNLCLVAAGFKQSYGAVDVEGLVQDAAEMGQRTPEFHEQMMVPHTDTLRNLPIFRLVAYASSWSFTQVMGYHAAVWDRVIIEDIRNSETHFQCAQRLMRQFTSQYRLNPKADFEQLGRCWNTGTPDGKTYDPEYVPNLLRRAQVWRTA